jgi:cobalt-zinc-cadmium efflux system protein
LSDHADDTRAGGNLKVAHSHPWPVDGDHHVLTTQVVIGAATTREDAIAAKRRVRVLVAGDDFECMTVEVEFGDVDRSLAGARIAAESG